MPESLLESIERLFRYQRAPERATRQFRGWKHNADILPRLQVQLELLLDAYGKFEPVVYDTQGIRDDGSDLVLRYRPHGNDGEADLICFQVKSFDDLAKKHYMQELKAQRDDSFRKVLGLQFYFLVLCTDGKAHKERVRSIMAEFRSADRSRVVEPALAYTFFNLTRVRVEALVTRVMETKDFVFRLALDSLELASRSARALTVFMIVRSTFANTRIFNVDQLLGESALRTIYRELRDAQLVLLEDTGVVNEDLNKQDWAEPEGDQDDEFEDEEALLKDFEMQLDEDLTLLETDIVEFSAGSQTVILRLDHLHALNAIATDALARYDYNNEEQLLTYMFTLMGVRD
jgi:hypothetical protein